MDVARERNSPSAWLSIRQLTSIGKEGAQRDPPHITRGALGRVSGHRADTEEKVRVVAMGLVRFDTELGKNDSGTRQCLQGAAGSGDRHPQLLADPVEAREGPGAVPGPQVKIKAEHKRTVLQCVAKEIPRYEGIAAVKL